MTLLTHEQADKEVEAAIGAPTNKSAESVQRFLAGAKAGMPQLPKESIKRISVK